jgi:excinuclease UvrABC ATPase subunit
MAVINKSKASNSSKPQKSAENTIQVVGARVHNLKNVTVSFPRNPSWNAAAGSASARIPTS